MRFCENPFCECYDANPDLNMIKISKISKFPSFDINGPIVNIETSLRSKHFYRCHDETGRSYFRSFCDMCTEKIKNKVPLMDIETLEKVRDFSEFLKHSQTEIHKSFQIPQKILFNKKSNSDWVVDFVPKDYFLKAQDLFVDTPNIYQESIDRIAQKISDDIDMKILNGIQDEIDERSISEGIEEISNIQSKGIFLKKETLHA
jgi:hypothetical protein